MWLVLISKSKMLSTGFGHTEITNSLAFVGVVRGSAGDSELFEKRQKGDYNDFFDFDEETVLRLYQPSMNFVKEIEKQIMK